MNNTEKVLLLLCKQIHLCTNVIITLDNLNSLKCNTATADTVENFWTILNILSRYTAKKENPTINLDIYDKVTATKLYFGYLNYFDIEFYSMSEDNDKNSVLLLIAFSWLIIRYNVLNLLIKDKVMNQIFDYKIISKNRSLVQEQVYSTIQSTQLSVDPINEFNVIIKKIMQINYNFKDITELINEKGCLLMKIYRRTSNISNMLHLNLSQLTLIKIYYTNKRKYCETDLQYTDKLNNAANMIDLWKEWSKTNHFFFKWMTNIVEECKSKSTIDINNEELLKYISTIRYLNKNKIYSLETNKIINDNMFKNLISSNFYQSFKTKSSTEKWYYNIFKELAQTQREHLIKVKKINSSMQIILNSVPHYKQI